MGQPMQQGDTDQLLEAASDILKLIKYAEDVQGSVQSGIGIVQGGMQGATADAFVDTARTWLNRNSVDVLTPMHDIQSAVQKAEQVLTDMVQQGTNAVQAS